MSRIDYANRYNLADEFSKSAPSFEQALEFGGRPEIGFTNGLNQDGSVWFGNSADSEGVFMALYGRQVFDRVFEEFQGDTVTISSLRGHGKKVITTVTVVMDQPHPEQASICSYDISVRDGKLCGWFSPKGNEDKEKTAPVV